ncbi:MAG: polysaccharide deacetylase family protein [Armatimonadota bacterium]|nr:polysaccharide deacetylase family protein [Armatimonadota bacterium]
MAWPEAAARDLRVLVYHRVYDAHTPGRGDPHLWSATSEAFAAQMAFIARHFAPVTAWQVADALAGVAPLPPRAILVTFDDGYRDFLTAWPILKRFGVPALVFVPTAFPGTARRFWWDELYEMVATTAARGVQAPGLPAMGLRDAQERWRAVRRLNRVIKGLRAQEREALMDALRDRLGEARAVQAEVLSWDDLRGLAAEGLAVGAHTVTHPALPSLTAEELHAEIETARADLTREMGHLLPFFAYPYGLVDERAAPVLRALGYVGAFISLLGRNRLGRRSPFLLYRQSVDRRHSVPALAASMTAPYVDLREVWRLLRGR